MCGIYLHASFASDHKVWYSSFMKMSGRGPDRSGYQTRSITVGDACIDVGIGFHHLRIFKKSELDMQPFFGSDGSFCVCNGEIYNYKLLRSELMDAGSKGGRIGISDCDVILPLYNKYGLDFINHLDGEFAIIIYDGASHQIIVARDSVGVRPLYWSCGSGGVEISSELKGMSRAGARHFPPGHVAVISNISEPAKLTRYFKLPASAEIISEPSVASNGLRCLLEDSVSKRLMGNSKIGALLSGGLDSSGVAAIAACRLDSQLETFTCYIDGLENEDLLFARKVAKHIGSKHHEIKIDLKEIFRLIDETVYVTESYNMEMIPNLVLVYLVGRYIRAKSDVRVLLDGTGPDEMLGGYWFFAQAPDDEAFHLETLKQLMDMHRTELLEDRALAVHGLETRYPYLDPAIVKFVASIAPSLKSWHRNEIDRPEKAVLRQALVGLLPDDVLSRKKLGMTHGAGKRFEYLFDQEIKARMYLSTDVVLNHDRIVGLDSYYKKVYDKFYPGGQNVECGVEPAVWRLDDPLAIWR